jgi:hypothetical protein
MKTYQYGPWKLWKGRKVHVLSADAKRNLGVWVFDCKVDCPEIPCSTPRFRQGKKTIYGWSCWWIPENEHQKAIREIKRSQPHE